MKQIEARYKRKVVAYPKGAIVHHGDCYIFSVGICTCGLIHDLMAMENASMIYAGYLDDRVKHDRNLRATLRR